MSFKTPSFWNKRNLVSCALWPLSQLYAFGSFFSAQKKPERSRVPVICVGNLTSGGAGKTPVAIALAKLLQKHDKNVHILTRGYGGREIGPLKVVPRIHQSKDVGDEPLLLAQVATTWVGADRCKSAHIAFANDAEILVMDDGFQHHAIYKDLSLIVIDGGYGFGNRFLMPAGPLRESLKRGFSRAHGVVLVGEDKVGVRKYIPSHLPVLEASVLPNEEFRALKGQRVLAFAGIARPEKFFDTLEEVGAIIVEKYVFPDHKDYHSGQLRSLIWQAHQCNAVAVTTSKDGARLWPEIRNEVKVLEIDLAWKDENKVREVLSQIEVLKGLRS